jgi:hypothetical protein
MPAAQVRQTVTLQIRDLQVLVRQGTGFLRSTASRRGTSAAGRWSPATGLVWCRSGRLRPPRS